MGSWIKTDDVIRLYNKHHHTDSTKFQNDVISSAFDFVWVNVADELPQFGEEVLLHDDSGYNIVVFVKGRNGLIKVEYEKDFAPLDYVIRMNSKWLRLPPPPEEL